MLPKCVEYHPYSVTSIQGHELNGLHIGVPHELFISQSVLPRFESLEQSSVLDSERQMSLLLHLLKDRVEVKLILLRWQFKSNYLE